ncbi:MAG: pilus assembly protein TadG-related protein [Austwickia sp.]|nr:pilus assembly protein TadG-related protein [Austwickia sp.]
MTSAGPRPDHPRDDGQVGLLVLGVCVVLLTLVVGIIDVTAIQLARVRLYDAADAAAVDAADAVSDERAYRDGIGTRIPLSQEGVRTQAARFLAGTDRPDHVTSWGLADGTGTSDGRTATVVLTGTVEVPLAAPLLGAVLGPVTITVTATAQGHVDPAGAGAPAPPGAPPSRRPPRPAVPVRPPRPAVPVRPADRRADRVGPPHLPRRG